MLAARSGGLNCERWRWFCTLVYLDGEANCTVQRGGPWVDNQQVTNMVRQPLEEDICEGFRGSPAASGQDVELHQKIHNAALPLPQGG